jgi:predicted DNA-binding transcriptional regulator AlpA
VPESPHEIAGDAEEVAPPKTVFVERKALRQAVRRAARFGGTPEVVADRLDRWLDKQRRVPDLVGTTEAARILGMRAPHVSRLRDEGHMPDAVPVAGGNSVYLREEIEALAEEREVERTRRRAGKVS